MKESKARELQTIRLFATLGLLTLLVVLIFKVVLFAPQEPDHSRLPAHLNEPALQKIIQEKNK